VAPTPSTYVNVLCPLMGLSDGAEAYHIDPRFNQGVSVTLAPSVTAINRVFEKEVFKCKGAIHPRPNGRGLRCPKRKFVASKMAELGVSLDVIDFIFSGVQRGRKTPSVRWGMDSPLCRKVF